MWMNLSITYDDFENTNQLETDWKQKIPNIKQKTHSKIDSMNEIAIIESIFQISYYVPSNIFSGSQICVCVYISILKSVKWSVFIFLVLLSMPMKDVCMCMHMNWKDK